MEILRELDKPLTRDRLLLAAHGEHLDADRGRLLHGVHQAERLVEIIAADEEPMMCPDDDAVLLHQFDGRIGDLLAARNHPRHDADPLRENHGILRRHLPELARERLVLEREDEGQCDEIGRMRMVDDAIRAVRHLLFELMRREMRRQLTGRTAAANEPPDDAVVLARRIDLDECDILLRGEPDVAHILAAARHEEIFPREPRHRIADRLPCADLVQRVLDRLHFLRRDAVRQISAVALMPSLLERISGQALKALHKL